MADDALPTREALEALQPFLRTPITPEAAEALRSVLVAAEARIEARLQRTLEEELQPVLDTLTAIAAMDLSHRTPISGRSPFVDSMAMGLNMLSEEIQARLTDEQRIRARLMQADRLAAVGQLAAGVAHEVNNPASYVLANLEVLRARADKGQPLASDSDNRELIEQCREGMERIVAVVKDLRVFSRIDAGQDEAVQIDDLMRTACRMAEKALTYRAELVLDLGGPPRTLANAARLTQVFTNLLINAAQALDEGRPGGNRVTVSTRLDGDEIVATVADTGHGIPTELQSRIFEPFFTTRGDDLGTGLGLSLAAEIIHQHGGAITFRSRPGAGTAFEIRLPLRAVAEAAAPVAVPTSAARLRVLVVDDDATVLRVSSRALAAAFEVTAAGSGREALAALQAGRFDAVLCDVMMPELDGPAVYQRATEADPTLRERFWFVSGGAFTDRTRGFLSRHAARTFDKPLDFKRIIAALRAAAG